MLIESAFLKLPELLLSNHDHGENVESMVVHHLATGLQMELNSRSVPFAYNHITVEKPYPNQNQNRIVFRADLLFDSSGSVPRTTRLNQYGFKEKQWLEAKSFFSNGKSKPPTTQNVGRVVKDVIRLCLLPEELQGRIRQNGRYVLLVFDRPPNEYLAFSDRKWLRQIFEKRTPSVTIDLNEEKPALVSAIASQRKIRAQVDISLSILHFEPSTDTPTPVFWGYLLRINTFTVSIHDKYIQSNGDTREHWDRDKIMELKAVRDEFAALLKSEKGEISAI